MDKTYIKKIILKNPKLDLKIKWISSLLSKFTLNVPVWVPFQMW